MKKALKGMIEEMIPKYKGTRLIGHDIGIGTPIPSSPMLERQRTKNRL
jgi:hypothetical protein